MATTTRKEVIQKFQTDYSKILILFFCYSASIGLQDKVLNLGSDTFANPISKGPTKLTILPDYNRPGLLCPLTHFAAFSKIGPDYRKKCDLKMEVTQKSF